MHQRVTLVTLGVRDLERSCAFYEALGWSTGAAPGDDVAFFQCGGVKVALWSRTSLAEDSCVTDSGGWGGITLAHNVASAAEVDAVLAEAEAAGAEVPRAGAPTFWGGYSGIFIDPDGHPWEVAHNPHWTVTALDHVQVAGPPGCEAEARRFYGELLGMRELPKPPALAARGGVWFEQLHVGVEDPFTPARKAHPALISGDLDGLAAKLVEAGAPVTWDDGIPAVRRFYTADPFGNRLEITS